MFKNAILYRLSGTLDLATLTAALEAQAFVPCTPSQEKSYGWTPPLGEEGNIIESVGGQWILEFQTETKSVPGSVVRRKVDERCADIEQKTGRKPGRKEKKELKEDIRHELLPMAFSRRANVPVWIQRGHPTEMMLVVGSASVSAADEIITSLVKAADVEVTQINTVIEPGAAMANWLIEGQSDQFDLGRACQLKATDESKAVVRYANHGLDIDEIRGHISAGKRPTQIDLSWADKVSFTLTSNLALRGIKFTDTLQADGTKAFDNFDATVALETGELRGVVNALIVELGGEHHLTSIDPNGQAPEGGAS